MQTPEAEFIDYSPYTLTCTLTYTLTYTLKTLSLLLENFWQLVKKVYVGVYVAKHIPSSNPDNHRGLQPFRVYVRLILASVLLCPNGQEIL